eukprot:gene8920-869_t
MLRKFVNNALKKNNFRFYGKLQKSHVFGDTSVPLIEKTIGSYFENQVEKFETRQVLVSKHQNQRYTWEELNEKVNNFAMGLINLGFCKGDRLGVWMLNNAEWIIAQLATAKIGVILVCVNPSYRLHELEHALNLVKAKGIILQPSYSKSNYINLMNELFPELSKDSSNFEKVPSLKHVIVCSDEKHKGMKRFKDIYAPNDQQFLDKCAQKLFPDEPINIQFTSGTTGSPKAATLTHRNILNNGFFIGEKLQYTENDIVCLPVPLYHCFGLVLGVLACLTHGSSFVFPNSGFEPISVLKAVQEEKCTSLYGVPTMFISELTHPDFKNYDLSTLRTGIMAGSICPTEVMKRVIKEMNLTDITISYGMTETSPVSFQTGIDDPLHLRVETVGKIHPHVECKVVDPETNEIVDINQPGELLTKGYSVMQGYWEQPDKTAESITEDGWMKTGDIVTIDEDGYCRITGRIKDMIIRGGENISPREIEEFLYKHEKIKDVAVVGVYDEFYGEVVCSWVILNEDCELTKEELQGYCKNQIAHYKIPHYVVFTKEFPQTVTGKIQKFIMKDETEKMIKEGVKL